MRKQLVIHRSVLLVHLHVKLEDAQTTVHHHHIEAIKYRWTLLR